MSLRTDGMTVLRGYQAGQALFPDRLHINVLAACYHKAIYDATIERTDGLGATERTRDLLSQLLADE